MIFIFIGRINPIISIQDVEKSPLKCAARMQRIAVEQVAPSTHAPSETAQVSEMAPADLDRDQVVLPTGVTRS